MISTFDASFGYGQRRCTAESTKTSPYNLAYRDFVLTWSLHKCDWRKDGETWWVSHATLTVRERGQWSYAVVVLLSADQSVSSLKQLAPSKVMPSKGGTVVKWLLLPCNFTRLAPCISYVEGCTNTSRCSASAKKAAPLSFTAEKLTFTNYRKWPVYWSFGTRGVRNTDQYSGHWALMG